jgi:toxin ParE1/3/4
MAGSAVVLTPFAETDLDDIWFEIALDNPAAADRVIDAIRRRSEQLSTFSESGRLRPDIAADARSLTVGNYLVLYRHFKATIEIVRIVHGARDLTALL